MTIHLYSLKDYQIFFVEITRTYSSNEWREDLKQIMKTVSSSELHGVFLFTDLQVRNFFFVLLQFE